MSKMIRGFILEFICCMLSFSFLSILFAAFLCCFVMFQRVGHSNVCILRRFYCPGLRRSFGSLDWSCLGLHLLPQWCFTIFLTFFWLVFPLKVTKPKKFKLFLLGKLTKLLGYRCFSAFSSTSKRRDQSRITFFFPYIWKKRGYALPN